MSDSRFNAINDRFNKRLLMGASALRSGMSDRKTCIQAMAGRADFT